MNRRQHLRQIARQSLITRSPGKPPLRPLAALCATLPAWAEIAGSRLLLALDQNPGSLSEDQKWGAAIAAAIATGHPDLVQAVQRDAEGRITRQTRDLAQRVTVAALLAQGASPGTSGAGCSPDIAQDQDAPEVALFALAATAAWVGRVDLEPRLGAAQAAGVADGAISSILAISHALAVIATLLNGGPSRNAAQGQESLRAS